MYKNYGNVRAVQSVVVVSSGRSSHLIMRDDPDAQQATLPNLIIRNAKGEITISESGRLRVGNTLGFPPDNTAERVYLLLVARCQFICPRSNLTNSSMESRHLHGKAEAAAGELLAADSIPREFDPIRPRRSVTKLWNCTNAPISEICFTATNESVEHAWNSLYRLHSWWLISLCEDQCEKLVFKNESIQSPRQSLLLIN